MNDATQANKANQNTIDNFTDNSEVADSNNYASYSVEAEKINARWAMIGFIALIGAYISTGQIIPGIY